MAWSPHEFLAATSTSTVPAASSTAVTSPVSFMVSPGRLGVPSLIDTLRMAASGPAQSDTKRPTKPLVVRMFMNTSDMPALRAASRSWCTGVKSREASAPPTMMAAVSGTSSCWILSPTFTSPSLGLWLMGAPHFTGRKTGSLRPPSSTSSMLHSTFMPMWMSSNSQSTMLATMRVPSSRSISPTASGKP